MSTDQAASRVIDVKSDAEFREYLKSDVVVVEFTAAWCGQCKSFAPKFQQLGDKYASIVLLTVDIDQLKTEIKDTNIIDKVPTFFVYKKGKRVDVVVSANEPLLEQAISKQGCNSISEEKNASFVPVTEQVTFSSQPSTVQLKNLGMVGIKSVINLRTTVEDGFNHNEETILKEKGIKYSLIPVSEATDMDKKYVDEVAEKIKEFSKEGPCLVHCKVGLCACIAVLLKEAQDVGAGPSDVMQWATDMGFNLANQPVVYQLVNSYLSK